MTKWKRLRWQRFSDRRYYEAHLKQDFFGWVVVKLWGSGFRRATRMITLPVDSFAAGESLLLEIDERRVARDYQQVT